MVLQKRLFQLGLLLIVINCMTVFAQEFYADLDITVDESGFVTIDGITNYPNLVVKDSQAYTFKEQEYWTFDLSIEKSFDFVYILKLPENSEINSINTSGQFRIKTENDNLIIQCYGEDEPLNILVKYQIKKSEQNNFYIAFLIGIILIVSFVLVSFKRLNLFKNFKKKNIEPRVIKNVKKIPKLKYDFKGLTLRQKNIMKFLIEKNHPVIMSKIVKELNLPKSSVSRNISSLELKGLIEKESVGVSTMIRLKK